MSNEPTASAFHFNVNFENDVNKPYEVAIFATSVFASDVAFRVVYRKPEQEWLFLSEYMMYGEDDFETKSTEILSAISTKVQNNFLLSEKPPVPQSLFELSEDLLRSGVSWDSNSNTLVKK